MERGKGTLDDDQDFEAGDRVMLKSPKEFYGNQYPRRGWDAPLLVKRIRQYAKIVIWDKVMWYSYIDPVEIKMIEYHVEDDPSEEYELTLKRFKGTT